ncbi:MAG: LysR family transcriptional regulator [Coriobacteriales bacterium]|jgi:DNA-binding transcriptional LysR family regulator|nr:LysR family transcriptional regulator [Coriobacteriales bacterium]
MNTDHFSYFTTLYKYHSYALAAKHIPMSTQGLTRAIHRLEKELGVELFITDGAGVPQPTAYADSLNEYLQQCNKDWQLLNETFDRIRAQTAHEIRLGTCIGILGVLGPEFLIGLKQKHGSISVNYEELDSENVEKGLLGGQFDLAITISPFNNHFVTTELLTTNIAYWVHVDNPLSKHASLSVTDLDGQPLALPGIAYKANKIILDTCKKAGVAPATTFFSDQIFGIFNFVLKGNGIGYTLPYIASLPAFADNNTVVCLGSSDINLSWGLSYLPTHILTEAERLFYDYCVKYTGDFVAANASA